MQLTSADIQRFNALTDDGGDAPDECVNWQGGTGDGYGRFRVNGRLEGAHRVAWTIEHGTIPEGKFVCHTCDNRRCVNAEHLFISDHTGNMRDAAEKGRLAQQKNDYDRNFATGERNGKTTLTAQEVRSIRHEYKTENVTYHDLGQKYDVSKKCIGKIIRRERWTHL